MTLATLPTYKADDNSLFHVTASYSMKKLTRMETYKYAFLFEWHSKYNTIK